MISLGAIEDAIGKLLPEDVEVLTTALPDGKKGEKVILLIAGDIDKDRMKELIGQSGLNPLMRPEVFVNVEAIPKLGSGKSDFSRAKHLAMEACA
jgi:acyl-[acyl-carrier-protein]-phospholipid O-acyltransferase/long-chain-fatty-acid--[acyl-carrier-protein] ligase